MPVFEIRRPGAHPVSIRCDKVVAGEHATFFVVSPNTTIGVAVHVPGMIIVESDHFVTDVDLTISDP